MFLLDAGVVHYFTSQINFISFESRESETQVRHRSDWSEHSLLLVLDHKFGHRGQARALVSTGFRQCPLHLLSQKLLKHQLQICSRFFDSPGPFLAICKHARSRALACLKKVRFSARVRSVRAPILNGALVSDNLEQNRKGPNKNTTRTHLHQNPCHPADCPSYH